MYQALYRKYRPQVFDDVVGQASVVKVLKNSIAQHKFCHAYMFFGSRGIGKTSLSKIFAKAVNCLSPVDGNPCGKCKNCLIASEKECVDILEIDAASNNGVDEIRELRNKINLVPAELKYKVYIIDEVHMLSIGAFNALLKTLEEPPEHAIFILATTDPQKVPETIISRCQCFSFQRISIDMLIKRLEYVCEKENIKIEKEVLKEIALSSDGGMRDSLGMLDKLSSYTSDLITMDIYTELNGLITKDDLEYFSNCVLSGDFKDVLSTIDRFNDCGKNLIQIISQFMYYLRDILVDYYVSNKEYKYDIHLVEKLITIINEKMFDIKKSSNPKIYIEVLLLNFMSDLVNVDKRVEVLNTENVVETSIVRSNNTELNVESKNKVVSNVQSTITHSENKVTEVDVDDFQQKSVENDNSNNLSSDIADDSQSIINLKQIVDVRVNNAFALANKQILTTEMEHLKVLNDYTFDQQIGYLVCEILNSKFRVASEDIIVISYEYDSIVKQNLEHLEQIEEVYFNLTKSSKKFAIISDEEWNKLKNEYIDHLRRGEHYQVLLEPEKEFKKNESDDIISNDAASLFGDIVEYD